MSEQEPHRRSIKDILRATTPVVLRETPPTTNENILDTIVDVCSHDYQAFKKGQDTERTLFAGDFQPNSKSGPLLSRLPLKIRLLSEDDTAKIFERYDVVMQKLTSTFYEDISTDPVLTSRRKEMPDPLTPRLRDFMRKHPGEEVDVDITEIKLNSPEGEKRFIHQERYIEPEAYGANPIAEILVASRYKAA